MRRFCYHGCGKQTEAVDGGSAEARFPIENRIQVLTGQTTNTLIKIRLIEPNGIGDACGGRDTAPAGQRTVPCRKITL